MNLYGEVRSLGLLLFFLGGFLIPETSSEKDVTIVVNRGAEECFFETIKEKYVIDIDYQVIGAGQGAFDISFYLMSPDGRIVVMDLKKSEKSHRIELSEEGDYKLCFDNRHSTFSSKTVYFELIVEDEHGNDVDVKEIFQGGLAAEDEYEVAVKDIEVSFSEDIYSPWQSPVSESIKKVNSHLVKIRHLQEAIKAFATKDKNMLERNFFRVNSWSIIQVLIMIIVGLVQVVMVKSLFDEHSKMHKVWKKSFR